ncbi:MAG: HAD family hydrolase [Actinomycetota bacterium]|nr:HAD family hydrolase [Actinomycetota bacterium]
MIVDLWDTIVDFDPAVSRAFGDRVARRLGHDPEEFAEVWLAGRSKRDGGSLREYLVEVGAQDGAVEELVQARHDVTREMLRPRPGTIETLGELRRRGLKLGMISVCSEDVPNVWPETAFADRFDATVFSCSVGLRKPDPKIYLLACEQLGVESHEAIFFGDGANDELAGAERVGMKAVLILRPEQEEPYWEEARGWQPRITSIPEIMGIVDKEG